MFKKLKLYMWGPSEESPLQEYVTCFQKYADRKSLAGNKIINF